MAGSVNGVIMIFFASHIIGPYLVSSVTVPDDEFAIL